MQAKNDRGRLITVLVIWLAFTLALQFLLPKPGGSPAQTQSLLAQAQKLEAEGRTEAPNVALADRIKKLEQAAKTYESFYNENKGKPEGWQARFQQINVYDYLGTLEGKSTHWYNEAENRLKDMEAALHGKSGTVKVEKTGEVREVTSNDLGEVATQRLNDIRALRDQRYAGNLTYKILDALVRATGRQPAYSYALALLLIVVVLKVVTWPLQKKQYQYMHDMQKVAPQIKEIQEKMQGRPPEEVQRRVMQVYKDNNVNLAGGCLPMLVLGFVLFPVFWMVRDYEYQFTNASFLWIGSQFSQQVWWMADNLAQFDVPLFIIYLASMVIYPLLQPKPADPAQAQQQKMMMFMTPVIFGVMMWMGKWSSAFLLYWLILNIVSIYQSWLLMKQFGHPSAAAAASGGGASGGSGSGGSAPDSPTKPVVPLEPMKGGGRDNGNGHRRSRTVSARVRTKKR